MQLGTEIENLFARNYYYVYIAANMDKTELVTGLAGSLGVQLAQWGKETNDEKTTKTNCTNILYWERFNTVAEAMNREHFISKLTMKKKIALISQNNPELRVLNEEVSLGNSFI